jgi:hypothetical protein
VELLINGLKHVRQGFQAVEKMFIPDPVFGVYQQRKNFSTDLSPLPTGYTCYSNSPLLMVSTIFLKSESEETSLDIFLKE